MKRASFQFKQFLLFQDKCAMKFGTDSAILGSLLNPPPNGENALDIGSGTGVLSLMLAQRSPIRIDAIEIQEDAFLQTEENFKNSPWCERLASFNSSLQSYSTKKTYDYIFSNPPYFSNSLKNLENNRKTSRHTDSLSFDELASNVSKLLSNIGEFTLILPVESFHEFQNFAFTHKLFCNNLLK